jgi:hypothetical protein
VLSAGGVNGVWMIATLQPVLLAFDGIRVALAIGDLRTFTHTARGTAAPRKAWLQRHT